MTHTPPQRAVGSGAVPTRLELTLLSLLPVAAGCVAVVESLGSTEILVGAGRGLAVAALVLGFFCSAFTCAAPVSLTAHTSYGCLRTLLRGLHCSSSGRLGPEFQP